MHNAVRKIYLHILNLGEIQKLDRKEGDSSIAYLLVKYKTNGSLIYGQRLVRAFSREEIAVLEPIGKYGR